MKTSPENLIKISLAVLLLICIFPMSYGFYQLFKYIALVGFAILAYYEYERKNITFVIVFVGLVLLFQPIAKVALGRQAWMVVDVVVAAVLILMVFIRKQQNK